jgi:hypothetical protein
VPLVSQENVGRNSQQVILPGQIQPFPKAVAGKLGNRGSRQAKPTFDGYPRKGGH